MRLSLVHWLIIAALAANAVVYFMPEEPASAAPTDLNATGSLRQLKLLSELDAMPPPRAATEAPPEPAPATEPDTVAIAEAPPEAVTEESAGIETTAAADSEVTAVAEPAGELGKAASPEPAGEFSEAAFPEPAQQIAVAGEGADAADSESDLQSEPEPEPVQEPEPPPPSRCWLAGPVENDAISERLAADFAAAGASMDLVLRTVEVAPDHWVYLPTAGSQADIRRLSRELRQDGFDNFQITDGPLAGSLSLGLFRSEERAIALQGILRARGHQVDIYLRPSYREQPWAAVDDGAREALGWPDEEGLVPGYEALELVSRECPADSDN